MIYSLPLDESLIKYYPLKNVTQWSLCKKYETPSKSEIRGFIGFANAKEKCLLMRRARNMKKKKAAGILFIEDGDV